MPARSNTTDHAQSRGSENGGRWKGGGRGGGSIKVGDIPGSEASNALLLTADLVDTSGVAVDGTATDVDNVTLTGDEIILRAASIGSGGDVDNGLWQVPLDPADPWVRYRQDLHKDGLTVLIRDGAAQARGAVSPLVDFAGMEDTHWLLVTDDPIDIGTDSIEFRQLPTHDGIKLQYTTGGTIAIPGVGTWQVPFDQVAHGGPLNDCAGLYLTPTLGAGAHITADYSALYYADVSILCGMPSGAAVVAVDLYIGPTAGAGAAYQQVIQHSVGTTDERFHGGSLVRLAGDDLEKLEVHVYDPAGAGFNLTVVDLYVDLYTVARR